MRDSSSQLANLTIRNGHVLTDSSNGIALTNLNARCLLEGLTVRGKNHGIALSNAKPTIRNSIIHNCGAYGILENDAGSDPVLDHNCFFNNVSGEYYDNDTAAALNTPAAIDALNPPASNAGNIVADPLFVRGPGSNYYLSQVAAGQVVNSPCVDHGNPLATVHGTTRTDQGQDTGNPDLGYHHALSLDVDVGSVSVAKQGQVKMYLAAGGKNAGAPYIIGCGMSGAKPGATIGGLHIPLNFDLLTLNIIPFYGSPMFVNFTGFLDQNGTARPVFDTLGPMPPLKGLTLTMVAVLPFTFSSNPIDVYFQ